MVYVSPGSRSLIIARGWHYPGKCRCQSLLSRSTRAISIERRALERAIDSDLDTNAATGTQNTAETPLHGKTAPTKLQFYRHRDHSSSQTSHDLQAREHAIHQGLQERNLDEKTVDAYFLNLLAAKQYSNLLLSWNSWKHIIKSGTNHARLANTRTAVAIAHLCTVGPIVSENAQDELKSLFSPLRPPRNFALVESLAKSLELSNEQRLTLTQVLQEYEENDLRSDTPAFLQGIDNLVSKFNAEALHHLYERSKRSRIPLTVEALNKFAEGFLVVGRPQYSSEVLKDMQDASIAIQAGLWNKLLNHAGRLRNIQSVEALWKQIQDRCDLDTILYTSLIDAYCSCGEIDRAFATLQVMNNSKKTLPNSVTCNVIVKGLVANNKSNEALKFVEETAIPAGMKPDITTYNTLLKSFLENRKHAQVKKIMTQMNDTGLRDVVTYTILLSQYRADTISVTTYRDKVNAVLAKMNEERIKPNAHLYSTVMNNLLFSKDDHDAIPTRDACVQAQIWLQEMKRQGIARTIIIYSLLLKSFFKMANPESAFQVWHEMRRDRVIPDGGAYTIMIRGLCEADMLEAALKMFRKCVVSGIKRDTPLLILLNAVAAKRNSDVLEALLALLQEQRWTQQSQSVYEALRRAIEVIQVDKHNLSAFSMKVTT